MKPFNLEQALAGKPVVTRDGREVKQVTYFETRNDDMFPIVAVVDGKKMTFRKDGGYSDTVEIETLNDLMIADEEYYLVVTDSELSIRSLDLRLSQTLHRYPVNNGKVKSTCFKLVKVENHEK